MLLMTNTTKIDFAAALETRYVFISTAFVHPQPSATPLPATMSPLNGPEALWINDAAPSDDVAAQRP